MDAYRDGDRFVVCFDLPGVEPDAIDMDIDRNVLTVKAERLARSTPARSSKARSPNAPWAPSAANCSSATAWTPTTSPPSYRRLAC